MIDLVTRYVIPAAYDMLPPRMADPRATAMLIAIGLQESRFMDRQQIGGPAVGFWQFESGGGVRGVLEHDRTTRYAREALRRLRYGAGAPDERAVYSYLLHNDILACCFARLLLWTVPRELPSEHDEPEAWAQYLEGWRPGKPHPETWPAFWVEAWERVHRRAA